MQRWFLRFYRPSEDCFCKVGENAKEARSAGALFHWNPTPFDNEPEASNLLGKYSVQFQIQIIVMSGNLFLFQDMQVAQSV